jgi:hypothetical protein
VSLRRVWPVTAVVWLAVSLLLALAGCGSPAAGQRDPGRAELKGHAVWLLTRLALSQVAADPAVRAALAREQVYEILQPGQLPLPGVPAWPAVTFASVAEMEAAISGNQLPAGTKAVLYDPEAWAFTPASEQRAPAHAAATAARLAHEHGLKLIVAPALNLTTVQPGGGQGPRWQRFLDLHLAADMAKAADFIELQAQSLERSAATYAEFIRQAAAQARAAHPGVTVLAGLSTNPPGPLVSSRQLEAAVAATRQTVNGYWLNIPGRGPRCPTCNPARPDIGIDLLRRVL